MIENFIYKIKNAPIYSAQTHHDRYFSKQISAIINELGENPRLYLITPYDAGAVASKISFDLFPSQLPPQDTMISATDIDNPYVVTISKEDWEKTLYNDFDYVYIMQPETIFVADYLSLFEDESQVVVDRLFKVIKLPNEKITLRVIEKEHYL